MGKSSFGKSGKRGEDKKARKGRAALTTPQKRNRRKKIAESQRAAVGQPRLSFARAEVRDCVWTVRCNEYCVCVQVFDISDDDDTHESLLDQAR